MTAEYHAPPRVADSVLRVHAENRPEKAEVRFAPGPTVLVSPGESLLRVAQANQVPLESGCRMGLCGADPVRVIAGGENLSPPSAAERATLQRLGLPLACRMACTARVRGSVTVALTIDERPDLVHAPASAGPVAVAVGMAADVRRLVVVGNGVAGVTAAVELRDRHPDVEITIMGTEPYDFYNRMIINKLVSESMAISQLYLMPRDWAESRRIRHLRGVAARSIDRDRREVITDEQEAIPYDRLLLATGAECFVPPIEGFGMAGSFVMRSIDDAVQLQQYIRRRRCRTAAVIGGGLLGLEVASSISQMDVRVFVLDLAPWPLSRQLDRPAGALLWQMMGDLGIKILPQVQARRVVGADCVEGVELSDGQTLRADLCLMATGIKPNVALAESAGLAIDRGVVVDERMVTSDPRVFAAGDVAAYEGRVHGLWSVGVEQARVAAANMLGEDRRYRAIAPPTKLKVAGIDLLSVGEITASGENAVEIRVDEGDARRYRKLVLRSGKVCGAILVGHPEIFDTVSEAAVTNCDVSLAEPALASGDWSLFASSLGA
jgi:NAD(P)H-nitrite reductase large subunit/ferredoxin